MKKNETLGNFKSIIVYISPAGATQKVADFIAHTLVGKGHTVELFDLSKLENNYNTIGERLREVDCLWIGSPIYTGHITPPLKNFILELANYENIFTVPFVTYGAVSSGVGLYEMGKQLTERGFSILGAAKIIASHSLLWTSKDPLGNGHPDQNDQNLLEKLIESVLEKVQSPENKDYINSKTLNYQSEKNQAHAKVWDLKLMRKNMPPIKFDKEKCTECNLCVENCPVHNITLTPLPEIGDNCMLCFNCIKYCESSALTNEIHSSLDTIIRSRVAEYGEKIETKIFI